MGENELSRSILSPRGAGEKTGEGDSGKGRLDETTVLAELHNEILLNRSRHEAIERSLAASRRVVGETTRSGRTSGTTQRRHGANTTETVFRSARSQCGQDAPTVQHALPEVQLKKLMHAIYGAELVRVGEEEIVRNHSLIEGSCH
jgi:hypothetical protein